MKKICNLITALFLTLTLFCSPVLAASAEDTARNIRESDGSRQTFPVGALRLDIPEMASEDPNTYGVRIYDVDAPAADMPLDE